MQFEGCRFVTAADHEFFSKKAAPRLGDILLGKAASTGKIARVKVGFEFSIWSPLALLRPDAEEINSTFLEYALKSSFVQAQIDVLCTHNTQSNISMEDIPKLVIPLPSFIEQEKIAIFLDWKKAQIDALIAKKQALIEKLKEKRLAVITQAVTKGLEEMTAMVSSGQLLADLKAAFAGAHEGKGSGHVLAYSHGEHSGAVTVPEPTQQLEVGTLQAFLDTWLAGRPEARIDYIHGADVARTLAQEPGVVAFLLPGMEKSSLFPTVIHDGVLPRKTFSMGEAHDKRFYLEARRILA